MAEIKVTKSTSVQSLKRQFEQDFKCTLVVYRRNNTKANDTDKIHELAKENYSSGTLEIGARSRVGNVESYFLDTFGLKVQIKNAAGDKLASNEMTLTQAGNM